MVNRILIIGNGFDIAHGVETSYTDLMNFIEHKVMSNNRRCGENHIHYPTSNNLAYKYLSFNLKNNKLEYSPCHASSILFKTLYQNKDKYNTWGNVEEVYFECLQKHKEKEALLDKLHEEFALLKELLNDYLIEAENKIQVSNFNPKLLFSSVKPKDEKLLGVINFNYTSKIVDYYISKHIDQSGSNSTLPIYNINIHGKLNDKDNPIIFGYGDDNSLEYREIQNLNDNKLLINFKTFQYLRNRNYRALMNMLMSCGNIKLEILGHSASISDKTLLKSIVEHKNVKDIEYRHHISDDKYFNNLHNLSRVFDENISMRDKIIPLSQTRIIPTLEELLIANN